MKLKKTLASISLVVVMSATIATPVFASTGDIYTLNGLTSTSIATYTKAQVNVTPALQKQLNVSGANFAYEGNNGRIFKLSDVESLYNADGGKLDQALADLPTQKTAVATIGYVADLTIDSVNPINSTANVGDAFTLPTTVTTTLSDGTTKDLTVAWDKAVNTTVAGTYTFNGTLEVVSGDGVVNTNNVTVTDTLTVDTAKIIPTVDLSSIQAGTGDILMDGKIIPANTTLVFFKLNAADQENYNVVVRGKVAEYDPNNKSFDVLFDGLYLKYADLNFKDSDFIVTAK